jgi:hypothetical protein
VWSILPPLPLRTGGSLERELLTRFHVRCLRKDSETASLDAPKVASNVDGSTPGHLVIATLPYHHIHMFSVRQVSGIGRPSPA